MTETFSFEEFEQQVRDCLAHLYDYSFLREQPLVSLLAADTAGAAQVQAFRQIVTETIERLRPEIGATFHSKQARLFNILMLRYIDQQQPQDVMQQMALSERQFYRDHPRAIQILSQLLWERVMGADVSNAPDDADDASRLTEFSLESEVQRVHAQSDQSQVKLWALLQGAITATQSLASQHHVQVELDLDNDANVFGISGSVLRQAVLLLMSQLIMRFVGGGYLSLNAFLPHKICRIRFALAGQLADDEAPTLYAALTGNKSLQALISALNGTLTVERQEQAPQYTITLDIPTSQQTVLLVDDNPDIIDLFQRWLGGQPYHVLVAPDGEQAVTIARQWHPGVIILDVMLPGTDGWEVLQNLKNHPSTRDIPVLVCSVLDACELALSLGADACLKKPPTQVEFLDTMARWKV